MVNYEALELKLKLINSKIDTLAGDVLGDSSQDSWQDVAKSLAADMRDYAQILDNSVECGSFPVFPSLSEIRGE